MAAKFRFSRAFQVGILGLMTQSYEFLITAIELVAPEYFEDQALIWAFQTLSEFFTTYRKLPKPVGLVMVNELRKAHASKKVKDVDLPTYTTLIRELDQPVDAKDYVIAEVVRFCRRQQVRKAMLDAAPMTDSDDDGVWERIEASMVQACNVGAHAMDIGIQYFVDYPERLEQRRLGTDRTVVPTGITQLDGYLSGGLKSGQLGIWMGGTGAGKSVALVHCGKRAVVQGLKVMHYTFELPAMDIAERYDASWSSQPIQDLRDNEVAVNKKLVELGARYGNSLLIKYYPAGTASVSTLRSHLQTCRAYGFVPDLIVIDYIDLMKPLTSYQDEYQDQGAIARDLAGLAGETRVPVWSATQINRAGYNQEIVDVEHVGDSLRKVQIADVVIALSFTRDERVNGILRLMGAKNRNGPDKFLVKIRTAYERMCFYQPAAAPIPAASNAGASGNAVVVAPPTIARRRPPRTVTTRI